MKSNLRELLRVAKTHKVKTRIKRFVSEEPRIVCKDFHQSCLYQALIKNSVAQFALKASNWFIKGLEVLTETAICRHCSAGTFKESFTKTRLHFNF